MKQILQFLRTGATEVVNVPCPAVERGQVLIRSIRTLVSSGFDELVEVSRVAILMAEQERH